MKNLCVFSMWALLIFMSPGYSQTDTNAAAGCSIEKVVDLSDGGSSVKEIRNQCNAHVFHSNCSIAKIAGMAGENKGLKEIQNTCSEVVVIQNTPVEEDQAPVIVYRHRERPNAAERVYWGVAVFFILTFTILIAESSNRR